MDPDADLEERLSLVCRPENIGEEMTGSDYTLLFLVTLALPMLLMVAGWQL